MLFKEGTLDGLIRSYTLDLPFIKTKLINLYSQDDLVQDPEDFVQGHGYIATESYVVKPTPLIFIYPIQNKQQWTQAKQH